MAKHRGRGIAAIEYPTGMNQNGDPSQAWIKVKPDGRIDVFAGTSDIGNGSKTIQSQIVAETIGVPYDWITYDNSNTDSSPVCTGTFASRATFVAGKAVEKAALKVREQILEIAGKELEIDPGDLEITDGEVVAKGAPQKKIGVPDVAAAATWGHGELITGVGAQLKPYAAIVEPETGKVDLPPHSAISYAACAAEVEGAPGVWITELPVTPGRGLRALEAKAEPGREGKKVVFDEELSVNTVSNGGMRFEVPA